MAPPRHFLVVTFLGQGHLNPSRALAARLARATGARVTLSASVSMHRHMFPSLVSPDEEVDDGVVSYAPYSDGYDDGFGWSSSDHWEYARRSARVGRDTLSALLDRLAARGRPVTCVVHTILLWWVPELARERRVRSVLYWVQSATMLAVYHHYLHGYERLVAEHAGEPGFTVTMPGLPPMAIRDLPSYFTDVSDSAIAAAFDRTRRTVEQLDVDVERSSSNGRKAAAMVLVNSVEALEPGALTSIPGLDVLPIGPVFMSAAAAVVDATKVRDLCDHDEKDYMEWLDGKPAKSVVYVSFGSVIAMSERQIEETKRGLAASGRPYLWVVRTSSKGGGGGGGDHELAGQGGMVVSWCDQARVLAHAAVGCFVTHCGWNSTLDSVASGVAMVAVPQWSDQHTNARLVSEWGVGVRAAVAADGVLEAEELNRCLDMAMGDSESGAAMRRRSEAWKTKVTEAIADGGSSDRNFRTFLDRIAHEEENQ